MNVVSMTARVRCKNKACGQKVPLSVEHVRQLGGKLRAEVVCPACGERFVPNLVRTVKTKADEAPAEEAPPVPIPVPTGAKKAVPPFRPLPSSPAPSAAAAPPPIVWQPELSPASDPMPFSPLQADAGDHGPGGGLGGWWKRLSKRSQYLILGGGIAVMAVFAFAVQTLGKPLAEEPPPATGPASPATQTPPTTPNTTPATSKRATVPTLRPPPPAPTIDVPPADEFRLIDPTTPRR